jgi:hypothetical protein
MIGSLFALIGLASLTAAWFPVWNEYRHGKQFAANGGVALGLVLTKSRASAGSVTVLGFTKQLENYFVRYRFTVPTGRQIVSDARVTPEQWAILEERGPIKVRYLPDDPETNHVSGQESRRSRLETLIFTLLGAGFTGLGALMVLIVLKKNKTQS